MAIKLPSFLSASKTISKKDDKISLSKNSNDEPNYLEKDSKEDFVKRLYEPPKAEEPTVQRLPTNKKESDSKTGFQQISNTIQNNASIQNSHDTQSVSYLKRISDDLYGIKNFLYKTDFSCDSKDSDNNSSGSILDILSGAKDFFKKTKKVPKGLSNLTKTSNSLARSTVNKPVSFAQNSLSKFSRLTNSATNSAQSSLSNIKNIAIKNNPIKNVGNMSKMLLDKGSPIMKTAGQMLVRSAPALIEGAVAAAPALAVAAAGYVGFKAGEQLNKAMEGTDVGEWKDKLFDTMFSGIDDLTGGLLSGVDPSKRKQAEEINKKDEADKETLFEKLNENLDSLTDQIKASMGDVDAQDRIFERAATGRETSTDRVSGSIKDGVADLSGIKEGSTKGGKEFKDKSVLIMDNLMKDFQLTPEQAAGVMGNLGHESGGLKQMQEIGQKSGRGGLGWAQWTGDRRKKFEAYAASKGLDTSSDEANYGYLKEELTNGSEKGAIDKVRQSKDLKGAVYNFERGFERSGDVQNGQIVKTKQYQSRYDYANTALSAYNEAKGIKNTHEVSGDIATEAVNNLNSSLVKDTQIAMDKGIKYNYGSKNSNTGAIDCSGWVMELNKKVSADMGDPKIIKDAVNTMNKGAATGGAAGIIQAVGQSTGMELSGEDVNKNNLKEGMVIGVDHSQNGAKSGAGRYKGIDHVTQVVKDPETGEMMISESSSKKGVHLSKADEWLERNKDKQKYAVDPYMLARGENGNINDPSKKSIMYNTDTANNFLANGSNVQVGDNNNPIERSSMVSSAYNQTNGNVSTFVPNENKKVSNFDGSLVQSAYLANSNGFNTNSNGVMTSNLVPTNASYSTTRFNTNVPTNTLIPTNTNYSTSGFTTNGGMTSSLVPMNANYSTTNTTIPNNNENVNSVFNTVQSDVQPTSALLSSATINVQSASINAASSNLENTEKEGLEENNTNSTINDNSIQNGDSNINNGYNTTDSSIINHPTGGILNPISALLNPINQITNSASNLIANPVGSILGALTNTLLPLGQNTNSILNNSTNQDSNLVGSSTSLFNSGAQTNTAGYNTELNNSTNGINSSNKVNSSFVPNIPSIIGNGLNIAANPSLGNILNSGSNLISSMFGADISPISNIIASSANVANSVDSMRSNPVSSLIGASTNYLQNNIPESIQPIANVANSVNNGLNFTRQMSYDNLQNTSSNYLNGQENSPLNLVSNGLNLSSQIANNNDVGAIGSGLNLLNGLSQTIMPVIGKYENDNYSVANNINPNDTLYQHSLENSRLSQNNSDYTNFNNSESMMSNARENSIDPSFVKVSDNLNSVKNNNSFISDKKTIDETQSNKLDYDNTTNKQYNKLEGNQSSKVGDYITEKTIETDTAVSKRNNPPMIMQQAQPQVIQQSSSEKTGTVAPMRTKPSDSALRRIFDSMLAQSI